MTRRGVWTAVAVGCACAQALGAGRRFDSPRVTLPPAKAAPTVDGTINDAEWAGAARFVVQPFVLGFAGSRSGAARTWRMGYQSGFG